MGIQARTRMLAAVAILGVVAGAAAAPGSSAAAMGGLLTDARPLAGPFGFETGTEGWTVTDESAPLAGLGGKDVATAWERGGPGLQSDVAFAVTPYGNDVATELTSPPLPTGSGAVVVEWWERYEIEGGDQPFDVLEVEWSAHDGNGELVRAPFRGPVWRSSPRWPDWNRVRLAIDPPQGAETLRLHYRFTSDFSCSSVQPCASNYKGDGEYLGAWIDEVTVWAASSVGERELDPTVVQPYDPGRPIWPDPVELPEGATLMDKGAFVHGARELERRFPELVTFTTVREELGDPNAVSIGNDGLPPWDPGDLGDGRDLHVLALTDETVPDSGKGYVVLAAAHGLEYCGLEATPRVFEDLASAFREQPETVIDGGVRDGVPITLTVRELLQRTKILFVEVSPDGWMSSQSNGRGRNTNRIAYGTGWSIPQDDVINPVYATLTEPAAGAMVTYLTRVRDEELGGRPFAVGLDMHGPIPAGALLFSGEGSDPRQPERLRDVAERMTQRTYAVLAEDADPEFVALARAALESGDDLRRAGTRAVIAESGETETDKVVYFPADWNSYGTTWESFDYETPNSWGSFFAARNGLGADAFTHEVPCHASAGHHSPAAARQLYLDNLKAILDVVLVHGATRSQPDGPLDLGGPVAYVANPSRVTDADGNPSPPPDGYPGTPFHPRFEQAPYDVANTDWFRDIARTSADPIRRVPGHERSRLAGFATVVVADHTSADVELLRAFAAAGGNVVLTDRALQLVPALFGDPTMAISEHRAYVGYADLVDHPWTEDLPALARQTYHPMPLGMPLLLERDQYWACPTTTGVCAEGVGPETHTQNSSPVWSVARADWDAVGGTTIGTVDPPTDPKGTHDGTATDSTLLGTAPLGTGRVVIFGAILPQPTEEYFHPFGLAPYALTPTGHDLLIDALTWENTVD